MVLRGWTLIMFPLEHHGGIWYFTWTISTTFGLPWHLVHTFMIPTWWIIMTLMIIQRESPLILHIKICLLPVYLHADVSMSFEHSCRLFIFHPVIRTSAHIGKDPSLLPFTSFLPCFHPPVPPSCIPHLSILHPISVSPFICHSFLTPLCISIPPSLIHFILSAAHLPSIHQPLSLLALFPLSIHHSTLHPLQ